MSTSKQALTTWDSRINKLQQLYRQWFMRLQGDTEGRLAAQAYLDDSSALYHGEVINMGYLPKLYDNAALDSFSKIVATTYTILDKMTQAFISSESYRSHFGFSPLLEQLIQLPTGYDCTIPITRIDIFLNEETGNFKFCEFNTDGTSAMNEDREICDSLSNTETLLSFNGAHPVVAQELFDPWVESFMDIYFSCPQAVPDPTVAIVDYMDNAVITEQLEFRRRFEHYGVSCLVVDVSSLEYRDGVLYARDVSKQHPAHDIPMRIDAVYRRTVTYELLRELEGKPEEAKQALACKNDTPLSALWGAPALVAAVARKSVCMIGGFKTQVAHSKTCFCMLHHPATSDLLTPEEQDFVKEHVPYTTWLKSGSIDLEAVKNERERWIIKPVDGYGTQGVEAGRSLSKQEWADLIEQRSREDYIIQEYCEQYQTLNTLPVPRKENGEPLFNNQTEAALSAEGNRYDARMLQPYNILTGLFAYAERFSGVYVRAGQDALIVGFRGGITLGSLLVDFEPREHDLVRPRALTD